MFELFMDDFILEAMRLRRNNDFAQLKKLLDHNQKSSLCHHHKAIAMLKAVCDYRLAPNDSNENYNIFVENFEAALHLPANLDVETQFLNVYIYCDYAEMLADIFEQYDKATKKFSKGEAAFNKATDLYEQLYRRDWRLQRYFTELYILIQYAGSRMYMSTTKSDTAKDYVQRALDMSKKTNSSQFLVQCYIMKAIYASRRRSIRNCQKALDTARALADVMGSMEKFKTYFKMLDRVLEMNKKGKWEHRGEKLVAYSPEEIYNIYRQWQRDEIFAYGYG